MTDLLTGASHRPSNQYIEPLVNSSFTNFEAIYSLPEHSRASFWYLDCNQGGAEFKPWQDGNQISSKELGFVIIVLDLLCVTW